MGFMHWLNKRVSLKSAEFLEQAFRENLRDLLDSPSALRDEISVPHPRDMDFILLTLVIGKSEIRIIRDKGVLHLDHRSASHEGWIPVFAEDFFQTATAVRKDSRAVIKASDFLRRNWSRLESGMPPS